jgi:hypothetical protein
MDRTAEIRLRSATPCGSTDSRAPEAQVLGEILAAQLIVFVVVITALLLALEVGLRRAQRRR